jgi:hypothetical protein
MEIKESITWAFLEYMYAFVLSETYGNFLNRLQINARNPQEMTKN